MAKKELNRKEYEKVKKMDHKQMEQYINSIYQTGYEKGQQDLDYKNVLEKIQNISGIGPKKMAQIMECF